jgi:hypothetical protein
MTRKLIITRDAEGKVVSTTEVRSSIGCAACVWTAIGIFVVVAPASWAASGRIPIGLAVIMYVVEAMVVVGAVAARARRT